MKIEIKDRFERKRIIVCGEYESIKDCLEKNLLANLRSADLRSANLTDIKNYSESHDIFQELCRKQDSKTFTEAEWSMIGFICIHRICWEAIRKRYGKKVMSVFKKLENKGWKEYAEKYAGVLKESKQ